MPPHASKRLDESVGELHLGFDDLNPGQPRPVVGLSERRLHGTELVVGALGQDPDSVEHVQLEEPKERPTFVPAPAQQATPVRSPQIVSVRSMNSMTLELNLQRPPCSTVAASPMTPGLPRREHRHLSPARGHSGHTRACRQAQYVTRDCAPVGPGFDLLLFERQDGAATFHFSKNSP